VQKRYNIGLIPGEGTGPEVVAEAVKALAAVARRCGLEFRFRGSHVGGERYLREEVLLPDAMLEEIGPMAPVLLGAIGHPHFRPGGEIRPWMT
jgi:3-isopropylmalate dehydrogenase